jgi:hypothetical protein
MVQHDLGKATALQSQSIPGGGEKVSEIMTIFHLK